MGISHGRLCASASVLTLMAGLTFSSPAVAQASRDEAAANANSMDIIVTAQRREESLSRVGVTVNVVGADVLASQGVADPSDLTRFVPGFQATQSYNSNPVYVLRGVGFNAPNANSTPPVGLYMDQDAIPYPYMSLGLIHDLERVEVLKGPQGTLYGRNATGGLVNFVAAKPTSTFSAGAQIDVGNFQTLNFNGFVSGPLSDAVRVRFSANSLNRNEGWQHSITRDDSLGKLHQNSFRGIVDVGDGGPFSATLSANYWSKTGNSTAAQSIYYIPDPSLTNAARGNPLAKASVRTDWSSGSQADWAPYSNQSQANDVLPGAPNGVIRPDMRTDSDYFSISLRAAYDINDNIQLASLTSYHDLDHLDGSDLSGFQVNSNFQDVGGHIESFSQEIRLIGQSDRLNWSIGGYYAKDKSRQVQTGYNDGNYVVGVLRSVSQATATANGDTRFTPEQIASSFGNYQSRSFGESKVFSVFGNIEYELNDQFKVSLGGRYTKDKSSQDACTYDYLGGNVPVVSIYYGILAGREVNLAPGQCYTLDGDTMDFVNGSVKSSQTQSNFAWRANVEYSPSDTALLYATISRGYKAGVFPLIAASRSTQFNPVRQEKLTAYELGTKLRLLDRSMQFNLSAFYYDYTDKQIFGRVPDVIFSTLSRIDNIPESHLYGVEADVLWRLSDNLQFSAAGVWSKSKIERYTNYDQFSRITVFDGKPYNYSPKFQGNMMLSYDQPVGDKLSVNSTVAVSYQSKSNASLAQLHEFRIDSYALVGATLGLASSDGWSATLYADNLFDKYYWKGVESATDSIFRFAGMPRQYGVRVGYKF